MRNFFDRVERRLRREIALQTNRFRIKKLTREINNGSVQETSSPVIIFNASTRISGLSQNAGFSLLASLALRAEGIPVIHFVCNRGLVPCVLGTNREQPDDSPPCRECIRTSKYIFSGCETFSFSNKENPRIKEAITKLDLQALINFQFQNITLGKMVLPSMRWILRKHHLTDDENTRKLARSYILSAWNIYNEFSMLLESRNPQAVIVFNGMFYPEAMARLAAEEKGIRVFSHEVGMLPFSSFFTDKEATAYPVKVDSDFELNAAQNQKLDAYLSSRFKGNFQTAGVKFWPKMQKLDEDFSNKVARFNSLVPVFTNVIFDTSQAHANTLFDHMFKWLDLVIEKVKQYPEILFIIRAHPDEVRSGKESRESVAEWYVQNSLNKIPNLIFIQPDEFISSYDLIQRANFVMVYNSTVGLEASIMGKPVLCAGRARYTQIPTVFFPESREDYEDQLEFFLTQKEIEQPEVFIKNSRRVLYSQLFRASIPFDEYLEEDGVWKGYVQVKNFDPAALSPNRSEEMKVLLEGILQNRPFIRDL